MAKARASSKKKGNGILFVSSILALFVVALVGFNFENSTSNVVRNTKTTFELTPETINAGQYININVNPGRECVNSVIGIYDDSDLRRATVSSTVGSYRKSCRSFVARYKTSPSWKPDEGETGIFFVKVFDYEKEDFIVKTFTILG